MPSHLQTSLSSFNYSCSSACLFCRVFLLPALSFLFFSILIFFNHSLSPFYQSIVFVRLPCSLRVPFFYQVQTTFPPFSRRSFCRIKALVQNQFPLLSILSLFSSCCILSLLLLPLTHCLLHFGDKDNRFSSAGRRQQGRGSVNNSVSRSRTNSLCKLCVLCCVVSRLFHRPTKRFTAAD